MKSVFQVQCAVDLVPAAIAELGTCVTGFNLIPTGESFVKAFWKRDNLDLSHSDIKDREEVKQDGGFNMLAALVLHGSHTMPHRWVWECRVSICRSRIPLYETVLHKGLSG